MKLARKNPDRVKIRAAKPRSDWMAIVVDGWMLGAEAAMVVPLRLARMAQGGHVAREEANLMVSEKVEAAGALAKALAKGEMGSGLSGVAGGVVTHYLGYVRSNRRRLTRLMLG